MNQKNDISALVDCLIAADSYLGDHRDALTRRIAHIQAMRKRITEGRVDLLDLASGHEHFGLHRTANGWSFREWAPHATAVYLVGDFSEWREDPAYALTRLETGGGQWEIRLPPERLHHGDLFRLRIHWPGGVGDRIPAYARRVVQDPQTLIFNAQVWAPSSPYRWRHAEFTRPDRPPLIYEVHVGMAQEAETIGTWGEFTERVLPRIVLAGYTTIQLMAVQEHPYYGSFGYHVSSFFAASSRFGTPEDLMALIDVAHGQGIAVIMDLVHSHSVSNTVEGLGQFDGTEYQYFHEGSRGHHHAWDSRCFDYGKPEVVHFLLSNCRYWLDAFHVDGFRFDGITSMLYTHHGLERAFTGYGDYFNDAVDEDALAYLALANEVIHRLRPDAITVAEDISGMPGLALPVAAGGVGFDYRFAMGVPDYWIRLTKDIPDEHWPMGHLWHELTNRRQEEKTISYTESHDQALVGDKTLIFRMADAALYGHMSRDDPDLGVDRAMALHKMIRLITLATAGNGYLNFMGNEFGHPEWIDFPREGNQWSCRYARRQWSLVDDPGLKYHLLARFDQRMIALCRQADLLSAPDLSLLWDHDGDKVLAFLRGGWIFVFNFHPQHSFTDYGIPAPDIAYRMVLDTDARPFGGHGRLAPDQVHHTLPDPSNPWGTRLSLYLPSRTGIVLAPRACGQGQGNRI
ncbi:alpha amylase C-terminal domain-containing protein [Desulfosarcina ovata]|uniref:1,4-alpha-glucan branching enzyme n=1 Tax=Desulfosarcina ovata subsp. ovata TaxID=2752305 RepID=A0A5K8AFE4_9BACT|nr:alpha-amylase family glycosyl hydrolase [Desulfosarcina ovata]BBO91317.1 1,4-alpha-glucan branching enzyme [Desulfosarcina ovata subsp. ovata]